MTMFHQLESGNNRHFFCALSSHLASLADDPCLPMYFQFALSANDRGRAVVALLKKRLDICGKRHLDVGCAYGGFIIAFSESGADSCGFDIDPTLLELARYNFKDIGREFSTYIKDVTRYSDIAEFDSAFDIITCNDVIEHVSDPEETVHNISLMLASGGAAYFEIPNRDAAAFVLRDGHYSLFGITQLDHDEALKYFGGHFTGVPYTVGHYLRLPEYQALLDSVGLEMEVLEESFEGIRMSSILDSILLIERTMAENLATVPDQLRDHVAEQVSAYLARALAAPRNTKNEENDFLLTYGVSFWKILARKKSSA